MKKHLHLTLFGWPIARLDGEMVQGFISDKAQALLYYLLLNRGHHARAKLAGMFWGNLPEKRATANLRNVVYNLQQLVPDYLVATRKTLAFNQERPHWVDLFALEAVLFSGTLEGAMQEKLEPTGKPHEALTLYQGDLLEGFFINDAPAFESWLSGERLRLRQQVLACLHRLVAEDRASDRPESAIPLLQQILKLEPWQEESHRQLMQLLARTGQLSEALAQYKSCQQLLERELEVAPLPETEALAERIRAARHAPRHNLPPEVTPFVGRKIALQGLSDRLSEPTTRLVTIVGTGGIGKTRLALKGAQLFQQRYLNGVALITLASIQTTPSQAAHQLAVALTTGLEQVGFIKRYQRGAIDEHLIQQLKRREMLLILDNFERFLDGIPLLIQLLEQAPDIQFLITSRERLNIAWEQIFQIEGLAYPKIDQADAIGDQAALSWSRYDAISLFIQSAQRIEPRFLPSEDNREAILKICHLVEGMPLGIELAAAWLRLQSCHTIAQGLAESIDLLSTHDPSRPDRHRSMRAMFDYSWHRLEQAAQRHLCQLAIFRGGFSLDAARHVVALTASDLVNLLDKSLLRRTAIDGENERYEFHELIHQLIMEKLSDTALFAEVAAKHSHYYLTFVKRYAPVEDENSTPKMQALIRTEIDNIQQAWQWAVAQQRVDLLTDALNGLVSYYRINGLFQGGSQLLDDTVCQIQSQLEAAPLGMPNRSPAAQHFLAQMMVKQAMFLNWRAKVDETLQLCQQLLPLTTDIALQQQAYQHMAYAFETKGQLEEAATSWEQSESLAHQIGNPQTIANVFTLKGWFHWFCSDFQAAQHYLEQAHSLQQQSGTQDMLCRTLVGLSALFVRLGDCAKARGYGEEAWTIDQRAGAKGSQAATLLGLGITCDFCADYENALRYTEMSLEIAIEIEERSTTALLYTNLSFIYRHMLQYESACRYGRQAVERAERLNEPRISAFATTRLGHVLLYFEEWAEAQLYYERATELWRFIKQPNVIESLAGLARVYAAQNEAILAKKMVDEVLTYIKAHQLIGVVEPILLYINCYHALSDIGQQEEADKLLRIAKSVLDENISKISDPQVQKAVRTRVPAHQEIELLLQG